MRTMVVDNEHLAAAVAAAAELAKNGGAFLYATEMLRQQNCSTSGIRFPMTIPPSPLGSYIASDDDDESKHNGEEDAERRVARSRERNREHARRTRLRKKAQLEALQSKVKGLQAESKVLKQSLEECSIASILVGLSSGTHDETIQALLKKASTTEESGKDVLKVVGGKRKRFVSIGDSEERVPQPLKIVIDGKKTTIGGSRTHINWKTGVYSDESGTQRQLTQGQLESLRYVKKSLWSLPQTNDTKTRELNKSCFITSLRRERNRMHAKMTRDRKKSFINTIEKTIEELESTNQQMKNALFEVIQTHFPKSNTTSILGSTPVSSPESGSVASSEEEIPALEMEKTGPRPVKKARHGFMLTS